MNQKHDVSEAGEGFRFPCDYQVKAMGLDDGEFRETVVEIIGNHCEINEQRVTCRSSANGKYLSVSVTIQAQSREQLDAIYDALTAHEKVLMRL